MSLLLMLLLTDYELVVAITEHFRRVISRVTAPYSLHALLAYTTR